MQGSGKSFMLVAFYTLVLFIATGCKQNSSDFEKHLSLLNKANKVLFVNDFEPGVKDLISIGRNLEDDERQILMDELMLNEIVVFENGGISYRFGAGQKYESEYYMVYINNGRQKDEFLSYEQFSDFQIHRVSLNSVWTFIEKKEFKD